MLVLSHERILIIDIIYINIIEISNILMVTATIIEQLFLTQIIITTKNNAIINNKCIRIQLLLIKDSILMKLNGYKIHKILYMYNAVKIATITVTVR